MSCAARTVGDEDAWQWYLARIVDLLGAPGSILHDELLESAGYPGVGEWAEIDLKREALLTAALEQFTSENSALVESLLDNLAQLRQLTTRGHGAAYATKPQDPWGYLNDRVSVQRTQLAGGIRAGNDSPPVSPRYQPKKRGQ